MTSGRKIITIPVLCLLLFAMSPDGNAQYVSNFSPNEDLFNYKVKTIEEFIERFNDSKTSTLRKIYAKDKKQYDISRSMLLVSLFNLEDRSFTADTTLNGFFRQVLDKVYPVFISFTDTGWYTEATAVFLHNGRLVEMPLVLHVKSQGDEWSKWMITGVGKMAPCADPMPSVAVKNTGAAAQFISTSAYITNFVELHYIFSASMIPAYYFEPELLAANSGAQFVAMIKSGKLKFQYVKKQNFHFYQVRDWVFTVAQYNRKTTNSGWLISKVQKVTHEQKAIALRALLNR